ncbi:5-methylcytosine-specific restriction endonuclease McrA [Rhizobium leguminosarum]|uniref:HNH endonuclease n=1 Tax=Rhizobium leguminosarum TaxID=384 RepID=UPI001808BD9A|nr:HNH endonuclease signature motif containing protein [Rhizobium leguminosarum]MBB5663213.1 5-methylcytosine-specific restriction endonuclease McrA [Rhizobium leguminosarum]
MRSVEEWRGKTDDSMPPPRVRDRIFQRHEKRCYLCSNPIKDVEGYDLDHVQALVNGGENVESNLRPVHRFCHVAKTAIDLKAKAKAAKVRMKHNGTIRPTAKIKSAPFPKSPKAERRMSKPPLPPRPLFEERKS